MSFVLIEELFEIPAAEDSRIIVGLYGVCAARLSKKGMEGRCQACIIELLQRPLRIRHPLLW